MTQYNKNSRNKNSGFSLIEVMVALTVLGVVFSLLIPMFISFSSINRRSEQRTVANNVARQTLELLRNSPILTMQSSGSVIKNQTSDGHSLVITTSFCPTGTTQCNTTSKAIKVEVKENDQVLTTINTVFSDYTN
jgi:prepilin-type N-terminal cleavage/methylation domain-containing protein